jgi:GntP family gluconate:H+ symporter
MESISYWPLTVLLIGIIAVVIQIAVLRIHAFIALTMAAILVGILSLNGDENLANAVELTMQEMGTVAGKIAFVIVMASILGVALTESGAAEKIVLKLIAVFGERFAPLALLLAGFLLSIPVFFDTVFFLLIPIAHSLGRKYKKNYMFYVLSIAIGGVLTHSLVLPTPGPLIMAETFSLNLGMAILIGLLACVIPAILTYFISKKISTKYTIEIPESGLSTEPDKYHLPSFSLSILPIIVPLILIIADSTMSLITPNSNDNALAIIVNFIGNKNMAMFIGTVLALWVLAKQKYWNMKELAQVCNKPMELAGAIILITSAGGAFGAMIKNSDISDMISALSHQGTSFNFIILAWLISSILKFAQGSGTVAMITSAGIMLALMESIVLPFHPVYVFLAIGFGSFTLSWMNDSAFWVVSKLSGFTEVQMLRTWTVILAIMSVIGLLQTLILSIIIPLN